MSGPPTCRCDDEWDECLVHVMCDDNCKALTDPTTLAEWAVAAEHWRRHSNLGGCSHGN